jgi:hypothetical protein
MRGHHHPLPARPVPRRHAPARTLSTTSTIHRISNTGQPSDRTPDSVFTAAGPVHALRDLGYLAFAYGVPQQPPASLGYDMAQVRDGRIAVSYTLLNGFTDRE